MLHTITHRFFFIFSLCFATILTLSPQAHQKICIIIPAYNEQDRIGRTLKGYAEYFKSKPEKITFLVVANNCSDNTVEDTKNIAKIYKNIEVIDLKPGGKGFAVKEGFLWALHKDFDLIGFVDADMATLPQYFYDLIVACKDHDGAIASRYAKGAIIFPERPLVRKIGGKFYNWLLRNMLGLPYKDTQCGAKIFTQDTIAKITPDMHEVKWSFDLELLYLCKLHNKNIQEIATTWSDQAGSHLDITANLAQEFLASPQRIKQRHALKKKELKKQQLIAKKEELKKQKTKKALHNNCEHSNTDCHS